MSRTSGASDLTELKGRIAARTGSAVLFGDDESEAWLPLSQVEIEMANPASDIGPCTVTVPEWLATKKGLV